MNVCPAPAPGDVPSSPPPEPLSLTGASWRAAPVDAQDAEAIRRRTGLSAFAARCLAARAPAAEPSWLEPSVGDLHDPWSMHNMAPAVARLRRALERSEKIRIITDYDVDGTTSSLILQAALRVVRPDLALDYHIPSRFDEGYGFSTRAAERAIADGIDLVLTADIGVRDHAAVDVARAGGLDVLICDHHLPAGASVPRGATVLCPPQAECSYPNPHLAACGVSLKVAQALLEDHPRVDEIVLSLCKLAAVGTVADMVPLTTAENRAIVTLGLRELNRPRHHAGLGALLEVAGLEAGGVRTADLGYRVGPRINAAGRVDDARLVVQLLNSRDPAEARELAARLDRLNDRRRDIQKRLVADLLDDLPDPVPPFVLVAGPEEEGWHRGVVGIVAARIKDQVHRPTAVVSIQGERAVGSVRSIPGVHAVRALDSAADLLVKYGGHPAAAGFTVATRDLGRLRDRLVAWVDDQLPVDELLPVHTYDGEVSPEELGEALFSELERIGPFGQGNPRPRLLLRDVVPLGVAVLGSDRSLLKFLVSRPGGRAVEAVWWDQARHAETLGQGPVDVLAALGEHRWRGTRRFQLEVTDVRTQAR